MLGRKTPEDVEQGTSTPKTLDSLYRFEGVSFVHLPLAFAPAQLAIPARLAAAAGYIIDTGRQSPGIFRVPGQKKAIDALYKHLSHQIDRVPSSPLHIQLTARPLTLPTTIKYDPYDVASLFKKLLNDIPNGILGSIIVFNRLKSILDSPASIDTTNSTNSLQISLDPFEKFVMKSKHITSPVENTTAPGSQPTKAEQIALALLKTQSSDRLSLISAVFGLLTFLKEDECCPLNPNSNREAATGTKMSPQAFGVIFAPLLLGNLTHLIEIKHLDSPKMEINSKNTQSLALAKSVERNRLSSDIIVMMICHWETVAEHLNGFR